MAKCAKCGTSSLTLKVDFDGLCLRCHLEKNDHLEKLEKFFEEYSIIPNATQEASRIIEEAHINADSIISKANESAKLAADNISAERASLVFERKKLEVEVQHKMAACEASVEEKLESAKMAVAIAEHDIAALYASAAKSFETLAKKSASAINKTVTTTKKNLTHVDVSSSPVVNVPLSPSEFKKAAKSGFITFDLETTGLSSKNDKIIEIGAIKYGPDFNEIERFTTFVYPNKPIPSSATAINGITDSMVATAPTIESVLPDFIDFIGAYPLVAHNAEFDMSFLQNALVAMNGKAIFTYVDSLKLAKKAYSLPHYKLGDIANHLGIKNPNAHRAASDCETLGAIIKDILVNDR